MVTACSAKLKLWWRLSPLALALIGLPLAGQSTAALTLEETLGSVEKTNINVLLGRESVLQALEAVAQQRAAILPVVNGSLQQQRSKSVSTSSGRAVASGPSNRFDGLLTGNVALFNAQRLAALRSARALVGVAEADFNFAVQSILSAVAQTYFAHLRNVHRISVLDANIARARALLNLARNQANAGVATRIDVTRAEAQLAQAEQARLQQDTVVYQSAQLLLRQLDINPGLPLTLTDFTVRRVPADDLAVNMEKTAFEQRADWVRAQRAVEQTKIDVNVASFERIPALGITGQYGLAAPKFGDSDTETEWTAAATLSVPLFDGFRISANRRIALSRQRAQELRLHNLQLQITAEVRLALQDAGSRYKQIAVAETSLRLAEEELRLAQQRYEQGVADNREVVDAQNSLAVASDNLNEAVYQYNLSRVELARTKGDVRTILTEKG